MNATPLIAVLGLGEPGFRLVEDLREAGAEVRGFDPVSNPSLRPEAVTESLESAVRGATVVLSVNSAAAVAVARQAAACLETRSAARMPGLESWALAEMAATAEMEETLGMTSHMALAAKAWLEKFAEVIPPLSAGGSKGGVSSR